MTDTKIIAYKLSLKSPYTGMTEDLRNKIDGIEVKDTIDYDLNKDGKIDAKDASIAGKVLRQSKKVK